MARACVRGRVGILASTIISLLLVLKQSCSAVLRLRVGSRGRRRRLDARGVSTCTGSCLREGQGETIAEVSMVITEGMPGQLTAVAFAAGQCGQARRTRVSRGRRGTVASVIVPLLLTDGTLL